MIHKFLNNTKWIFIELFTAFHRLVFALKIIKQYKMHLKPGRYILKNGSKIIIGRKGTEKSEVYCWFPIMDGINESGWKINFLICLDTFISVPLFVKKNNKGDQKADILMATINGDTKLFVSENDTVLTFIKDENKYLTLKSAWYSFASYFNIPPQQFKDTQFLITEKLIRNQKQWNDVHRLEVFKEVINNYKTYIVCEKNKIRYVTYNKMIGLCQDKMKKCGIYLQEILDDTFSDITAPVMPVHGDLHFGNVLNNELSSFFIDWENTREDWLFYDIFNIMYVLAAYQQNYLLIDMYLAGMFDDEFKVLCEAAGLDACLFSRKQFLLIYLTQRFVFDPVPEICRLKISEFISYCQKSF